MSALSMSIGRKLGRLVSVFTWGKLKEKLKGNATKASVILLAVLTFPAATCVRDFGIGFGIGVVEGVRDCVKYPNEPGCMPPAAIPTQTPTPSSPTPNSPEIPDSSPTPTHTAVLSPTAMFTPTPPVPTPTPTPEAEPRPTVVPPTARPVLPPGVVCMLSGPPWIKGAPLHPVPVRGGPPCPWPVWRGLCVADWASGTWTRLGDLASSIDHGHVRVTDDGYLTDDHGGPRPGCDPMMQDRYGRIVCGDELVETADGTPPFGRVGIRRDPPLCPAATPTPSSPGPVPTAPAVIPRQPDDFRLNFVNGCAEVRYPRLVNNEQDVRGQCDTTPRYIATLKSGKRWGNACDADHYHCAKEVCDGITPEELQAHVETWELCAGRFWDSAAGSRIETDPAIHVERDDDNPYQHWMTAPAGSEISVRACPAEIPVVTIDGLTVPTGGDGCGPWKRVKFEAH